MQIYLGKVIYWVVNCLVYIYSKQSPRYLLFICLIFITYKWMYPMYMIDWLIYWLIDWLIDWLRTVFCLVDKKWVTADL